jgi:hypothetical protein
MRESSAVSLLACASMDALKPSTMQSISSVSPDYSFSLERSAVILFGFGGRGRVALSFRDDYSINLIE